MEIATGAQAHGVRGDVAMASVKGQVAIVGAEVRERQLSLRAPLVGSTGAIERRRVAVLRLASSGGLVGLGEASPPDWLPGESFDGSIAALRRFAHTVADGGLSIGDAVATDEAALLDAAGASRGVLAELPPAARNAVQTALLDLLARSRELSVAELLGADGPAPQAVSALLVAEGPEDAACNAADLVVRGFRCLKLKVGGRSLEGDVAIAEAVRSRVGPKIGLRLDANRAWGFEQAVNALGALAGVGADFIEEPLASSVRSDLAGLRERVAVRIAVDESVRCADDLASVIEAGAADVLVLKLARVGGPLRAMELARTAHDAHLAVVMTDSIESSIGMQATVQVAAALGFDAGPLGLGGASLLADDIVARGRVCAQPQVEVSGPGLGVTLLS